ncbi:MAG: cytochrome c [Balneolia bacterium]|nr:cytochrome c [Balneolia bacterium]
MADNEKNQNNKPFGDEERKDSIFDIHTAALREAPLPEEGNERGPVWMYVVIVLTLAFGFFYMGRYLGEVSDRAHVLFTAPPGAEVTGEVEFDLLAEGQRIYTRVCQACHQANGEGISGVFPSLVGAEWVVDEPDYAVMLTINGLRGELVRERAVYDGVMPGFGNQLDDLDIAAVISYVRSSFGNDAGEISEDRVAQIRELTADKSGAYTAETIEEWITRIEPELEGSAEAVSE